MERITAEYNCPAVIEERKQNIAAVDIYSRLLSDRIVFLGSKIDDSMANSIQAQLLYLDAIDPGKPISLYINSPGGLCDGGFAIYDTIKFIKSPVMTICTGMCASMAAVLLAAGARGGRAALPHSRIMIHQPMGGAYGQASDIQIAAREIEKCKKDLEDCLCADTGQSHKKVHADMDRDCWMSAEEALKYGIIDKIVKRDESDGDTE